MEQIHIGDGRTRSIDAMCDMTTLEKELDKEFEQMSIKWHETAMLNKMEIYELESYFRKRPKSNKKIIAICEGCGTEREICFCDYRRLCMRCAKNLPESRESARLKTIAQWSDPESREVLRLSAIKRWSNPVARKKFSEIMNNSDAVKIAGERQIGGLDTLKHHVAYDFLRPNALTVEITRKFHGYIHHPLGCNIRGYSLID